MKKLVVFVVIMLGAAAAYSQPAVRYNYDNSGNRNSRLTTMAATVAQWIATGSTRCAVNASNENTSGIERQERDNNPNSNTYNQTRWVLSGVSVATCPVPPHWAFTGTNRCQLDANGLNTGYEENEQIDMNPRSATYGQKQWVQGEYLEGLCPLACDYNTCDAWGPEYHCAFGSCEVGIKVYTYSEWDWDSNMFICYYQYEFSDGYYSPTLSEYNPTYCF